MLLTTAQSCGFCKRQRTPFYLDTGLTDIAVSFAELSASAWLAWGLAAFFLFGSVLNAIAPASIRASFTRWGYPDWFHYVTAALEFLTAVLLVLPAFRLAGVALAILVMIAAIVTLLHHDEHAHAVAPCVVLALATACGWLMV
ncbi:DoxX family protein [Pigmentiphaga aceris]|uniref:DoxX family protein n=1 Tax=Pigmentiphaga aceris TaxID=1940612 RepID=A0A5C0B424_9BURK|nr:DoxX family protein [Pigmentiphaga aceris]QEI07551.1 DoxX family protein [Pigmentiphaga aceris]